MCLQATDLDISASLTCSTGKQKQHFIINISFVSNMHSPYFHKDSVKLNESKLNDWILDYVAVIPEYLVENDR